MNELENNLEIEIKVLACDLADSETSGIERAEIIGRLSGLKQARTMIKDEGPTVSIEDLRGVINHLERVRQIDMINGVDDGSSDIDTGRQYAIDKIKALLP